MVYSGTDGDAGNGVLESAEIFDGIGFRGRRGSAAREIAAAEASGGKKYPFPRNKEFDPPNPKLSDENLAGTWNNFYEFSTGKEEVHRLTGKFVTDPWPVEIGGLCEKPFKADAKELVEMMPMEERVYRLRCVEAWSMIVPWTGFRLSKLIEKAQPKAEAKYVRFVSAMRKEEMPGIARLPIIRGLTPKACAWMKR